MKKVLMITALVVLFAVPAMAGIVGSKHDFSDGIGETAGTSTQICVYCHAPHNAQTGLVAPLWNRNNVVALGTMYSNAATLNHTVSTGLLQVAPLCLSCHNGQNINTAVINPSVGTLGSIIGPNLGGGTSDLSNDHPIGFSYSNATDTALKAIGVGPTSAWFRTVGATANVMDCTSCHMVHGDGLAKTGAGTGLFRASMDASGLCLTCHIK